MKILAFLLILLAACGPVVEVSPPPQLAFTPGPGITVTDRIIDAGVFRLVYPGGWRVRNDSADRPITVLIFTPDERWVMIVSVAPINPASARSPNMPPETILQTETREIILDNDLTIYVLGSAPEADWDAFVPFWEATVGSLQSG